jgi:hypothetical protein
MKTSMVAVLALFVMAGTTVVAGPVGQSVVLPVRPPVGWALAAPRAELTPLPADGSGYYRLELDQAMGRAALVLLLEVRAGKVGPVAAVPLQTSGGRTWWPGVDNQLQYTGGKLQGNLCVALTHGVVDATGLHADTGTVDVINVTLDVPCEGAKANGTYTMSGNKLPWAFGRTAKDPKQWEGAVIGLRQALASRSDAYECELFLPGVLPPQGPTSNPKNPPQPQPLWVRLAMEKQSSTAALAWVTGKGDAAGQSVSAKELPLTGVLTFADGKLTGTLAGPRSDLNEEFSLAINAVQIGPRLVGTVENIRGGGKRPSPLVGLVHDTPGFHLTRSLEKNQWTWQHDLPADAGLTAQAQAECKVPAMPGEPGKTGFWTWRHDKGIASVYPPNFDLRPVEGASSYRFSLLLKGVGHKPQTFDAKQPWESLAPIWAELKPQTTSPEVQYTLEVTALDAEGEPSPTAVEEGIVRKEDAQPGTRPLGKRAVVRRPPFDGPYAKVGRDYEAVSLGLARVHRDAPGALERRGLALQASGDWNTVNRGDHGYGTAFADRIWAALATRALATDPRERAFAEEQLQTQLMDLRAHQRSTFPAGVIYDYQFDTPLMHWPGEAILDAWLQTGDARWKEAAIALGKGLVACQADNGAFWNPNTVKLPVEQRHGPSGFFTWKVGYPQFYTAELLYLLGRIRRDTGSQEFVEAERKAYEWAMVNHVQARNWPINVCHSFSSGYPITQHCVAALYFGRYLLECAPAERQDLNLALALARWSENSINWTRAAAGEQKGKITPRIESADRYNNYPATSCLLSAIVFAELGQLTGDALWQAKADALAGAVLQAVDRATGRLNLNLEPQTADTIHADHQFWPAAKFRHNDFCSGWSTQLLREYGALQTKGP